MSELDLANGGSGSGSGDDSPRPATRGGWEGGHALTQQGETRAGHWHCQAQQAAGAAGYVCLLWLPAAPSGWCISKPLSSPAPTRRLLPTPSRPRTAPAAGVLADAAGRPAVDETADKLDSMMELTFAHLERRAAGGQLGAAWDTLLAAFERSVLLTHRSKFTQVCTPLFCLGGFLVTCAGGV